MNATRAANAPLVDWALDTLVRLVTTRRVSKRFGERLATALLRAQDAGDGARVAWMADRIDQGFRACEIMDHAEGLAPEKANVGRLWGLNRLLDVLEADQG